MNNGCWQTRRDSSKSVGVGWHYGNTRELRSMIKIIFIGKLLVMLSFTFFVHTGLNGQQKFSDSLEKSNVIGFIPSKKDVINGVAIGLFESRLGGKGQTVNGITVAVIGNGGLLLMAVGNDPIRLSEKYSSSNQDSIVQNLYIYYDSVNYKTIYRGIVLAGSGVIVDQVVGVSIGGISSSIESAKGFIFNALMNNIGELKGVSIGIINQSHITKGLQIGLFNKTYKLEGLQIGLWNKNQKRSFPIINW